MRIIITLNIFILLLLGLPVAGQADFTWDVEEGCAPLFVRFAIDTGSIDISTVTTAEWDFGNGVTLTAAGTDTVSTTFRGPKFYSIKLTVNNAGTSTTKFYNGVRAILDSSFEIVEERDEDDYTYSFHPVLEITDTNASYWFVWEHFYDNVSLRRIATAVDYTNPEDAIEQFTYPDTGIYVVQLGIRQIKTDYTCESQTDTLLPIFEEFEVGNVFAPASTDYYIVDPENSDVVLSFILFGRTGIKIFEQESQIIYWDGRNFSGHDMSTGVYYYVIKATQGDPTGDYYSKTGFIHLFR